MGGSFFEQLRLKVRSLLNDSPGCSWLQSQNYRTIANYTLEEAYELIDAIDRMDKNAMLDEIADLCFHLIIYTEMRSQGSQITLEEVAKQALEKINQRGISTVSYTHLRAHET